MTPPRAMVNTRFAHSPLKWAGSKLQVLPHILPLLPPMERWVEPFVGSGTVFLNIPSRSRALLSDNNPDLIGFLTALRDGGEPFLAEVAELMVPGNNVRERFDALRDEYNGTSEGWRRAVLFLYLNRHCFNGLYRVNSKGLYNVPFGKVGTPLGRDFELRRLSERLQGVEIEKADFEAVLGRCGAGDVVYCDPAYVPLSLTANFRAYTAGHFSLHDQERLAFHAERARERGATVLISNHDTPLTRQLYAAAEGVESFPVRRTISRNANERGAVLELIAIYTPR